MVDLDDGWTLLTNVIGVEPEQVHIGMRVKVTFEHLNEHVALPLFLPESLPVDGRPPVA